MHRLALPLLILLALALCLPLGACATTARPARPTPIAPAPEPPPAALCAPLEAEPLPPEGIDDDALTGAVVAALGPEKAAAWLQWAEADWPSWARRGWRRLEAGRKAADC